MTTNGPCSQEVELDRPLKFSAASQEQQEDAISGARPRDRQSARPWRLATSHQRPPAPPSCPGTPCQRGFPGTFYDTAYYKIANTEEALHRKGLLPADS